MKKQMIPPKNSASRFSLKMLMPTTVVLLVMTAYPLVFTLYYSLTDYNLLRNLRAPASFVALENYGKLLADHYFQQAVWNTVRFTILAVFLRCFWGLPWLCW
jgi:multiple sugar transport system permease protein